MIQFYKFPKTGDRVKPSRLVLDFETQRVLLGLSAEHSVIISTFGEERIDSRKVV